MSHTRDIIKDSPLNLLLFISQPLIIHAAFKDCMTKIGDVMRKDVVLVDENATVDPACRIMGEKHIGCVVVTRKGKPPGIFTERDLLSKVVTKGIDMKSAKVKDFTSEPLVTINPDFHLREAARIMSHMKIKRLVVMKDNQLVGIFTARDLAEALSKSPLNT